jgi:hypothetical protein
MVGESGVVKRIQVYLRSIPKPRISASWNPNMIIQIGSMARPHQWIAVIAIAKELISGREPIAITL